MHVSLSIIVAGLATTTLIAANSPVAGPTATTAEAERTSIAEAGARAELPSTRNISVDTHTGKTNEFAVAIFHFDRKIFHFDEREKA